MGNGEVARYEQFLLFLQCFQKTCIADTWKSGLVRESVNDRLFSCKSPAYVILTFTFAWKKILSYRTVYNQNLCSLNSIHASAKAPQNMVIMHPESFGYMTDVIDKRGVILSSLHYEYMDSTLSNKPMDYEVGWSFEFKQNTTIKKLSI